MTGRLLVAGYLTIDISARVERIPDFDERITATEVVRSQGGMAANCACAAARHGTEVGFFGHAGTDALGDEAIAELETCGVDTEGVLRSSGSGSICLILIGPDGGRMIVSEPLDFEWARFDAALAGGAAGFYVDGYRLAEALPRASAARVRGLRTSIDLDGVDTPTWADARTAAAAFSTVFLNRGIAAALGGTPETVADELVRAGAEIACVTLGAVGAVVAAAHTAATRVQGVRVETVDTTGAGDAFAGAFLHRVLAGAEPLEAAAFANEAAALSTTVEGARGFHPPIEERVR
ncbi:MAG TPA: carbohydrate kinase family protein [Gaiellaceae bacterium]|nr:carbohydrate kinase family protein [Gaiellaceae bacterium]